MIGCMLNLWRLNTMVIFIGLGHLWCKTIYLQCYIWSPKYFCSFYFYFNLWNTPLCCLGYLYFHHQVEPCGRQGKLVRLDPGVRSRTLAVTENTVTSRQWKIQRSTWINDQLSKWLGIWYMSGSLYHHNTHAYQLMKCYFDSHSCGFCDLT